MVRLADLSRANLTNFATYGWTYIESCSETYSGVQHEIKCGDQIHFIMRIDYDQIHENYDQIYLWLMNLLWAYKGVSRKVKVFQPRVVEKIIIHLLRQDDVMPGDLKES